MPSHKFMRPIFLVLSATVFSVLAYAQPGNSTSPNEPNRTAVAQWRWMDIVAFNVNPALNIPSPKPEQKAIVEKIWGKAINSTPINRFTKDQSRLPSFVLFSSHTESGIFYTFSIFDAAEAVGCIPPGNGAGIVDMYSECPLRVTAKQESTGKEFTQQFDSYCHLFINDKDNPSIYNHTEIQIDEIKGVARFRVIQHGKQVEACNRTLRYKEVKS